MQQINFRAFTLVELIVVITIIGILATVGFVSYSSYLTGARDSNRISQMSQLSQSLQVYGTKKSLPLPDNYVEITAAVTTIAYQGELGVDVLEAIDYSNGGKDPKDDMYYSYYVPKSRNVFQLMALMEEQSSVASLPLEKGVPAGGGIISQSYAADYSERFPKVYGRKLGIMTDSENAPLERLSLTSLDVTDEAATATYISYISEDEIINGDTSSALAAIIPNASCKRIKQTGGGNNSGTYNINPGGTGNIQVYCDMENAGGGWFRFDTLFEDDSARGEWRSFLEANLSDNFSNSCLECGSFPQYLRVRADIGKPTQLYCMWRMYKDYQILGSDYTKIEYSVEDMVNHTGKDGLFYWQSGNNSQIRSESDSSYTVYEEILCR